MSLPSRERGLKYGEVEQTYQSRQSLPSRERGLKCVYVAMAMDDGTIESLPSRERGLKWIEMYGLVGC